MTRVLNVIKNSLAGKENFFTLKFYLVVNPAIGRGTDLSKSSPKNLRLFMNLRISVELSYKRAKFLSF